MTRQDVLKVADVANILGISKNTIQRKSWRERTGCPLGKIGKGLRGLTKDLEEWMRTKYGKVRGS